MIQSLSWRLLLIAAAGACSLGSAPSAHAQAGDDADRPDAERPTTSMIVVVGADGTPEYGQQFREWADSWSRVAAQSESAIHRIGLDSGSDIADRDQLEKALRGLEPTGRPVWLVLIGHGTFARDVAKFNLRGRDVSAREIADWLQPLQRTVVVVNCASSSGPFINRISAPNRVIVTATKSGMEQNFARFGKHFAEAIASPDSDLDHDDEVSVHEAFVRASASVQQFYDTEARISTEHALIDDNGDGRGTPAKMFRGTRAIAAAKDGTSLDGKRASRVTLSPQGNGLTLTAEEIAERDQLESQLDALRETKAKLTEEVYFQRLEALMIPLAKIYQAAEARADSSP